MLSLNSHTPTLTVTDPRSLPVRSVKYLRSTAGQAAQAHIDRTAHDAVGRATARWDPRLQSVQKDDPQVPANLNILHSLGGQVLLIQASMRVGMFNCSVRLGRVCSSGMGAVVNAA